MHMHMHMHSKVKTNKLYPTQSMLLPQSQMQTQTAELFLTLKKEYFKQAKYK